MGCKVIFNPDNSQKSEKLLIVQGYLNSTLDMVEVEQNYTSDNAIKRNITPVCCSQVFVTDPEGFLSNLEYYTQIIDLLEVRNSYFDSIPVKLSESIYSTTDPYALFTGFFKISDDTKIERASICKPFQSDQKKCLLKYLTLLK